MKTEGHEIKQEQWEFHLFGISREQTIHVTAVSSKANNENLDKQIQWIEIHLIQQ